VPGRVASRAPAVALLAAAAVALCGEPAGADPAGPTNQRSRVVAVEPPSEGAVVRVVGGDAFLELSLDRGHEVVVPGYGGEPYLRFRRDGRVEENRRSPAVSSSPRSSHTPRHWGQ